MNNSPVAGIDVSKEYSDYCILTPDNTVFSRGKIFHHPASMDKLCRQLDDVEKAFGFKPICIMESTAYYHRILYRYLTKHGHKVMLINALQSKAAADFNIRSAKTDKIDAYKLALLYGI
jgi:transposase